MRTSHFAGRCSTNVGSFFSLGIAVVALLMPLVFVPAQAAATNAVTPRTPNEIKITASLGAAKQQQVFQGTVKATGSARSYTYSIVSGTLPTGLALHAATGAISGTPVRLPMDAPQGRSTLDSFRAEI